MKFLVVVRFITTRSLLELRVRYSSYSIVLVTLSAVCRRVLYPITSSFYATSSYDVGALIQDVQPYLRMQHATLNPQPTNILMVALYSLSQRDEN